MGHEIRVLETKAELKRAAAIFYAALVAWPPPKADDVSEFYEPGRCIGVFDGSELVGTAASFTSWLSVPGGRRIPQAAITDVGVLPSHTRRGVAGALIRQQFADAAARGEIVASLRASEAVIYERFGYGVANSVVSVEIITDRARFRPTVPAGGPIRLIDPLTSWDLLAKIYDPIDHPGAIERHSYWWRGLQERVCRQDEVQYLVVHGNPGSEDGFAWYSPLNSDAWFSGKNRTIAVSDFIAHTASAYLGLLRFFCSIDLIERVRLGTMPLDHSLSVLLTDGRAVQTIGIRDETWLRLIDVEAALAARSYAGHGSVVIGVADDLLPANTGSYRVGTGGVSRTGDQPDLTTDVASLAAAYLGGTPWWQLALAGRVTERSAGALALVDSLFAVPKAPFSGTMF